MRTEAGVKKYIYNWLSGLKIGPVFQDRKPYDDTTKLRKERTYILYDFPDGLEDQGPWYRGTCIVCIGCRDNERFVANLDVLDKACKKFLSQFEMNDYERGFNLLDVQYVDDGSDGVGNYEYRYSFDVFAEKEPEIED